MKTNGLILMTAIFCCQVIAQTVPIQDRSVVGLCKACEIVVIGRDGDRPKCTHQKVKLSPGKKIIWVTSGTGTPEDTGTITFLNPGVLGEEQMIPDSKVSFREVQSLPPGEYFYTISLTKCKRTRKCSIIVTSGKHK